MIEKNDGRQRRWNCWIWENDRRLEVYLVKLKIITEDRGNIFSEIRSDKKTGEILSEIKRMTEDRGNILSEIGRMIEFKKN